MRRDDHDIATPDIMSLNVDHRFSIETKQCVSCYGRATKDLGHFSRVHGAVTEKSMVKTTTLWVASLLQPRHSASRLHLSIARVSNHTDLQIDGDVSSGTGPDGFSNAQTLKDVGL